MEVVEVLGIDPSLRFTGFGSLSYNTETGELSKPKNCGILVNPPKFKGTEAIKNMLDMIEKIASDPCFANTNVVIVESPAIIFNAGFSGGSMVSVAHIAGGAACLFGLDRAKLFRPAEWNGQQKKDLTHTRTQSILGSYIDWEFKKHVKSKNHMEHILDGVSMALWYIKKNYMGEDLNKKRSLRRIDA